MSESQQIKRKQQIQTPKDFLQLLEQSGIDYKIPAYELFHEIQDKIQK